MLYKLSFSLLYIFHKLKQNLRNSFSFEDRIRKIHLVYIHFLSPATRCFAFSSTKFWWQHGFLWFVAVEKRTSHEIYGMKINFSERKGRGEGRWNSFLRRANEWHRFSTGRGNSLVLFLSATQLFELNAVFKRNVLSCCREKTVSTPAWPQIKNLFQRRAAPSRDAPVSRAWIEF